LVDCLIAGLSDGWFKFQVAKVFIMDAKMRANRLQLLNNQAVEPATYLAFKSKIPHEYAPMRKEVA
jgi:hypothetical protein